MTNKTNDKITKYTKKIKLTDSPSKIALYKKKLAYYRKACKFNQKGGELPNGQLPDGVENNQDFREYFENYIAHNAQGKEERPVMSKSDFNDAIDQVGIIDPDVANNLKQYYANGSDAEKREILFFVDLLTDMQGAGVSGGDISNFSNFAINYFPSKFKTGTLEKPTETTNYDRPTGDDADEIAEFRRRMKEYNIQFQKMLDNIGSRMPQDKKDEIDEITRNLTKLNEQIDSLTMQSNLNDAVIDEYANTLSEAQAGLFKLDNTMQGGPSIDFNDLNEQIKTINTTIDKKSQETGPKSNLDQYSAMTNIYDFLFKLKNNQAGEDDALDAVNSASIIKMDSLISILRDVYNSRAVYCTDENRRICEAFFDDLQRNLKNNAGQ